MIYKFFSPEHHVENKIRELEQEHWEATVLYDISPARGEEQIKSREDRIIWFERQLAYYYTLRDMIPF